MNMNNIVGLSWVVALALGMTACTKNDTTQTATTASSTDSMSTHASMTSAVNASYGFGSGYAVTITAAAYHGLYGYHE